jgi:hypothetical protein
MINFREWRAIFLRRTKGNTRRREIRDEKNEGARRPGKREIAKSDPPARDNFPSTMHRITRVRINTLYDIYRYIRTYDYYKFGTVDVSLKFEIIRES